VHEADGSLAGNAVERTADPLLDHIGPAGVGVGQL